MAIMHTKKGFALLISVIFMTVMLTFGLVLGSLAYKQQVLASNAVSSQYAFYVADAALECALQSDQQLNAFDYATYSASAHPPMISCDGASATELSYAYGTALVTKQRLSFAPSSGAPARCADVTVYKYGTPLSNGKNTYIFSQGYDVSCTTVSAPGNTRFVSRGLNISYSGSATVVTPPTPTNTYATWNPADAGTAVTLSNGNLTMANTSNAAARSTIGMTTGKWYWEVRADTVGSWANIGVANSSANVNTYPSAGSVTYQSQGNLRYGSANGYSLAPYTSGDIIGVAYDTGTGNVSFYKNNVLQGTWNAASFGVTGTVYAMGGGGNETLTANFGANALTYTPPTGFNAGLYQ